MNTICRPEFVPVTDVWKREDTDFTPWLKENIAVLSDYIGFQIVNPEIEQYTSDLNGFRVDIKAELKNENHDIVIIENQYGNSDHKHLGELLTYVTSFSAKVAIWIVEEAKPEHVNVINWLNESDNGCSFFLISLKVIKVDYSIAPLFSIIAKPSQSLITIGKERKNDAKRHVERKKYWTRLLEIAKDANVKALERLTPSTDNWIAAGAGKQGINYTLWVTKDSTRIELRIDTKEQERNDKYFEKLKTQRNIIDASIPGGFEWIKDESRRRAIQTNVNAGWATDEDLWDDNIKQILNILQKLIEVTKPLIKKL